MTDRFRAGPGRTDDDERESAAVPFIPDGGLGSAMPEWMREPPSWKRAAAPAVVRPLPEADDSEIDPRRLIELDDLPQWLRDVAVRMPKRTATGAATDPNRPVVSEPGGAVAASPFEALRASRDTVAAAGDRPGTPAQTSKPLHTSMKVGPFPTSTARPWWISDVTLGILLVAIVITIIYVVLTAFEVI